MTGGATVTLHAVDLAEAERRWRTQPIAEAVRARPDGRVATLGAPRGSFAQAAAALAPPDARALFEALVEDLAAASLHDAPFSPLAEVCDRLARLAKDRALELAALEAAALAYPAELRAAPERDTALVVWLEGARCAAAARAAAEALAAPRGSELGRELLEALVPILAGPTVVAQVVW